MRLRSFVIALACSTTLSAEPSAARGSALGEEPSAARGSALGEEPSAARGSARGEEPSAARGSALGEEPSAARGSARGEEPLCVTRVSTPVLDGIRAHGEVRIGTTGDYAPFSFVESGERRGIDVELGTRLALDLGVRLTWVPTSWPTLSEDLEAGRFDVAIGGVTVTPERRANGCFTDEYVTTGKTVLARCDRAARFTSLDSVDHESVRVIVNPGGTNARFVESHLVHATIVRHPDNVSIFSALADGAADLMITDAVEAVRVAAVEPRLCAPIPETFFERVPKAIYLPADAAWRDWLDAWLDARRGDGTLATLLTQFGVTLAAPVGG